MGFFLSLLVVDVVAVVGGVGGVAVVGGVGGVNKQFALPVVNCCRWCRVFA